MNRSARLLLMLGMIFGVLTAASAQEPVPAQNNPQNSGATISGRVTIGGKGSPSVVVVLAKVPTDMRKAIQQLLTDGLAGLRTTTDLDGSYTFTGVQAGHYQVSPFAPSCASKIGEGTELAVNDGDTVGGIDFALERGGVITGRVTASDGRPLIGMEVSAFPDPGSANGEQAASLQSLTMRPHTTDDRGVYRLYGLPAGRYQVHVVQPTPARTDPDSHATYYPGVEDPASAGKVDITAGSEAAGIDIKVTIRSSATYRLSGRVVDESGNPVAGVQVTYGSTAEGRAGAAGGEPVQTNSVGEFHMQGLHNGSYQATVFNGIGGE
ncbi:MAG TPA: carboxypeptidase-like regulatory domain-containing protein, partial [Blastocatellia bacterium]|nr:carboxypeptidase-like regulatory domain-containing protein [Blastocatellia bacterium]